MRRCFTFYLLYPPVYSDTAWVARHSPLVGHSLAAIVLLDRLKPVLHFSVAAKPLVVYWLLYPRLKVVQRVIDGSLV